MALHLGWCPKFLCWLSFPVSENKYKPCHNHMLLKAKLFWDKTISMKVSFLPGFFLILSHIYEGHLTLIENLRQVAEHLMVIDYKGSKGHFICRF